MHKLASKTMIEILPDRLIQFIESKLGSIESTPDFFDVIGQVINGRIFDQITSGVMINTHG